MGSNGIKQHDVPICIIVILKMFKAAGCSSVVVARDLYQDLNSWNYLKHGKFIRLNWKVVERIQKPRREGKN